jgi:hypothetical protein
VTALSAENSFLPVAVVATLGVYNTIETHLKNLQ